MKTKISLFALLLAGWGLASAQEATTQTFPCIADTWIRESAGGDKNGSKDSIELGYDGSGDTQTTRAGLLAFDFAVPDGMKVQSATFCIYSKLARTGKDVYVYEYPHDFSEADACWNVEVSYHDQALMQDPIAAFRMGGHGGKSIYDSGINSENQSLDKWINNIDITDYVKSLSVGSKRINLMMKHEEMSRFYPKGFTGNENLFPGTDNASTIDKSLLAPVLIVTFVEDAASTTEKILPLADTQIRKGNTADNSKATSIEIKSTAAGDEFYGLMRFSLPSELLNTENYQLTAATLRLVCVQNKGDRNMLIYDFGNDFMENTKYENEEAYITAALSSDPIAEFSANGLGTMSMGDNKAGNWSDYTTANAWSSYVDLADYINDKISENKGTINILIKKKNLHNDAMKFATKEATDITNEATNIDGIDEFTFLKEDLWPQLTITYVKKEASEEPVEPELPVKMIGDANDDGKVTVSDVVTIANYIVNKEVANFYFPNANVAKAPEGEDEVIDVADITATVELIYEAAAGKQEVKRMAVASDDMLVADNFKVSADQPMTIGVCLDNTSDYAAIQAEIKLPTGMTLQNVELGSRAADHSMVYNMTEDGTLKVVIYSLSNVSFANTEGSLFNLIVNAVEDCGNVTIDGIRASDASHNTYDLGFKGGLNLTGTTGIEMIESTSDAEYYNLQGVRVANPDNGIYIRIQGGNASKVIIRK